MKRFLFSLFVMFSASYLFAQVEPPEIEWEKTYGGANWDRGHSVQQTTDGGYIVVGSTDSFGAGDDDVYLVKTDPDGNLVWQQTYGDTNEDRGYSVQQTTDGGYIVVGSTDSFGAGDDDVYLVKTDASGNKLWQQTYGGANNDVGWSVQQTTDLNYVITGQTDSFQGYSGIILKVDALSKNVLWEKLFQGNLFSIIQDKDNNYIATGYVFFGEINIYVVKLNQDGEIIWEKNYGGIRSDHALAIKLMSNGNYILAGHTNSFDIPIFQSYILELDKNGKLIWDKAYDFKSINGLLSIDECFDGGFIAAGYTAGPDQWGIVLLRTDRLGKEIWRADRSIFPSLFYSTSIKQIDSGEYIFLARDGNNDIRLIKLAPEQPSDPCTPDQPIYQESKTQFTFEADITDPQMVCGATLEGVMGVRYQKPYIDPVNNLRTMVAQVTKFEFTGVSPDCGPISIVLNPDRASTGNIVEKESGKCFPASACFDLYLRISITNHNLDLFNKDPIHMCADIIQLPPEDTDLIIEPGSGVDLYDYDNPQGTPRGREKCDRARPGDTVRDNPIPEPERIQLNIYLHNEMKFLELTQDLRDSSFKKDKPTIVITHGWQPIPGSPITGWITDIAKAIHARLESVGVEANILAWDWDKEASTASVRKAATKVLNQSKLLSTSLIELLGPSYNKPLHLMGHSFGSYMMSNVCEEIIKHRPLDDTGKVSGVHLTLWDTPDFSVVLIFFVENLSNQIVALRKKGVYTEQFSGGTNKESHFVNVWVHSNNASHLTYNWYKDHIPTDQYPLLYQEKCNEREMIGDIAFHASPTLPTANPLKISCRDPLLDQSFITHITRCKDLEHRLFGKLCIDAQAPKPIVQGAVLNTGNCATPDDTECVFPSDTRLLLKKAGFQAQGAGGGGVEPTYTLKIFVQDAWDYISFEYEFLADTSSIFSFSIKDNEGENEIIEAEAQAFLGQGPQNTGFIDIKKYHAKEIELQFNFSADTENSAMEISNVSFWSAPYRDNSPPEIIIEGGNRAIGAQGPITQVSLDGSQTIDPDGDEILYIWENNQGVIETVPQILLDLPLGGYEFTLTARDPFDAITRQSVIIEVEYPFIRGDSNNDGLLNITDPILALNALFINAETKICKDAADANDKDGLNLTDAIYMLSFLYLGGPQPMPPYPDKGLDPTPELGLGCDIKK